MSQTLRAGYLLVNSVKFARSGATETIDTVVHTVSNSYKPASDSALWQTLATVGQAKLTSSRGFVVQKSAIAGVPGVQPTRRIPIDQEVKVDLTFQQRSQITWEMLFGTPAAVTLGTSQTPAQMTEGLLGWWKIGAQDHGGTQIFDLELWLSTDLQALDLVQGQQGIDHTVNGLMLYSSLNLFDPASVTAN